MPSIWATAAPESTRKVPVTQRLRCWPRWLCALAGSILIGSVVAIWMGAFPYLRFPPHVQPIEGPGLPSEFLPIRTDELLVKKVNQESGIFIVKERTQPWSLGLDLNSRKSIRLEDGAFDSASGPSQPCWEWPIGPEYLSHALGRSLEHRSRRIRPAGRLALKTRRSPTGARTAVLSASGPIETPAFFQIGRGSNAWGQHFHQVFSNTTGRFVDDPVRLPFATAETPVGICWSPDEEYAVYIADTGRSFVFVPADGVS